MPILANENFPEVAIAALRACGHDVVWIGTDGPGRKDRAVLQRAETENRVLVTFDKEKRLGTPPVFFLAYKLSSWKDGWLNGVLRLQDC